MTTVQSIMQEKLRAAEAKAVAATRLDTGRLMFSERWCLYMEDPVQIATLKETRADIFELLEGFRIWASGVFKRNRTLVSIQVDIGPDCALFAGIADEQPRRPGPQEAKFYLHPNKHGDVHGYYYAREWQVEFWSELAKFDTETIAEALAEAMVNREYGL